MSGVEDANELKEAAEAGNEKKLAHVSISMAIFAVLVALTGLLGHRSHTEEIMLKNNEIDNWAYYQAKDTRRSVDEHFLDALALYPPADKAALETLRKKNEAEIEKYRNQQKEIQAEANALKAEGKLVAARADRFDLGESLMEIALVICSLTLLTERRGYFYFSMVIAVGGVVAAASAFLLH